MRFGMALALLLITTPVYAQTMGSTSGSMAMINSSDPPSTTSRVISAPTVVAPGLAAAGVETCLGSASGGLSAMGGGFTFGTTTVDEGCTIRLLARQLYAFGFQHAALALMCEDKHVVVAMYAAGSPCPRALVAAVAQSAPHSFFTLGSEPNGQPSFAAAMEPSAEPRTEPSPAPAAPSPRMAAGEQSSPVEITGSIPRAVGNEPSLRSFFAAIFEPGPASATAALRVRENGID
jgi:hypothetical protein